MADIPGNSTTTRTITVGGTTNDTLEVVGDHDWFRISLTAGQSISVALDGLTLEDPYLRIYDSSGRLLFENDDTNPGIDRDSLLAFTADYTGVYYIDVGAWDENYTGTYQLSITTYTPPPVATASQIADQLVNGYWGGDDHHFNVTQGGTLTVDITALTAAGQELARAALQTWEDIIGVNFVEVTSGAQITFDDNEEGAFSESNWANGIISSSHVNIAADWIADYGTGLNTYSFQTYIHEIGHALGLGHAGNYNGNARFPFDALFYNDSWPMSIMSYYSQRENTHFAGQGFDFNYIVTPMMADILAMSALYGLSTTTRADNSTYGLDWHNNMGALCIFDSGGVDTIDLAGVGGGHLVNLNPGTFSNVMGEVGNVSIAYGVIIENVTTASGADTLIGNSANNVLDSGAGNDSLSGAAGDDWLVPGWGNNSVDGGAGIDTVDYVIGTTAASNVNLALGTATNQGGAGHDTLTSIENVRGTTYNDTIVGDSGANVLEGHFGNDTIDGGAGDDTLIGDAQDAIDHPGGGADSLVGGAGNDILIGGFGNDVLDGGSGADQLNGGLGDDIYHVDQAGDVVTEAASQGTDEVRTALAYVLGTNVENLRLTGTAAVSGTGNALANIIRGNEAANLLAGLDGADKLYGAGGNDALDGGSGDDYLYGELGNDTLTGGAGYDRMYGGVADDTYMVNDATDFAYELAGEGTDRVIASLDHQLRDHVENLTLTGLAAVGKGNALGNAITGNAGVNKLYGYDGNDTLDGGAGDDYVAGGNGNDTLIGGIGYDKMYGNAGDDTFIVNDATDFAYENAGEGYDTVVASVTHSLRANIEELELTGTADIRGYGNAENNLITGNSGANLLYGRDGNDTLAGNAGNDLLYGENGSDRLDGGAGQDRYYGGAGADQFIFDDGELGGLSGSTADRIMDFSQLDGDKINLADIDANSGLAGDQGFSFVGTGAFTGTAGQLRYFQSSGTTYLQGDTNGDGAADFLIRIDGLHTLGSGDFGL